MTLEMKKVYFKYPGGDEVLKGASLLVRRGEVVSVVGANGSGKTTLLMVAAGLLEPDKGCVLIDGKPLREQLPGVRRRIGLVFQDPDDQLFNPTVYDEIAFTLRQIYRTEKEVREKVKTVAERFKLEKFLNKPPYELSIGEKRKVALASVLAYDPDVLLLDEPNANMSAKTVEEIEGVIYEARSLGKAVLVTSHDVEFVADVSDRVYVLSDGVLMGGSATRQVLSDSSLLNLADMRPPLVLEALRLLNVEMKEYPLTIKELRKNFDKLHPVSL